MIETIGAVVLLGYVPGALLYRLPLWQRERRAALAAEERVFWHVVLSLSWTLTVVLALAGLDLYRFDRLLLLTGAAAVAMALGARGALHYRGTAARVTPTALLPIVLVGLSVWQFFPVSEYIIGGRDPGVYFNEGIQIAQRGSLVIRDQTIAAVPAFASDLFFPNEHRAEYYSSWFMGFFIQAPESGRVVGQFPHLFPASIAVGYGLDGLTGARQAVAWWGVLGVLAVYFVGARLYGWLAASLAAGLLTLHVIQIWFSRYPNADVVMQAGLFAALLATARAHEDDDAFWGPVAAWLLGLQLFARADALLPMVVFTGAILVHWAVTPGTRLRWRFIAPLVVVAAIGLLYQTGLMAAYFWRYRIYVEHLPVASVAGASIAGIGLLAAARVWRESRPSLVQKMIPAAVCVTLIGLGLYAYFLREPGGRLAAYDAYALRDFVNLYLGPWMFAFALAGLALAVRRDFWKHPAFFLTFAAISLFLLYKLRVVPEHFWQARRFLAIILPGAILLGSGFAFGVRPGSPRWLSAVRFACGFLILAIVAPQYARASAPIRGHVEYRNVIPYLETFAGAFGPRDLVIVEARDTGSDLHVLATPLAYIYAKSVLVLRNAAPDRVVFREFLVDALTRYERVFFVGTGGTTLLSRDVQATPTTSDRVQVDEFETTIDKLPTAVRHKEFDYGIYQLTLGTDDSQPLRLDVGERDDLHLVRFHAKEQSEGRSIRWTQDRSEVSVTGLTGSERSIVITMSDGGRPSTAAPARVDVFLNGTRLGTVDVMPGFRDYPFSIPAAVAEAAAKSVEPATLRLESTVWSPRALLGVNDGRELGVMVDTIAVR